MGRDISGDRGRQGELGGYRWRYMERDLGEDGERYRWRQRKTEGVGWI